MSKDSGAPSGVGFIGLLTILFIGLKLGDFIQWSWWWVLSPIWITLGAVLLLLVSGVAYLKYKYRKNK